MRRLAPLLSAVVLLPVLAACKGNANSAAGSPLALLDMSARAKTVGYSTAPTANFYRAGGFVLSSAASASDTCVIASYPISSFNEGTVISGGVGVVVTVPGGLDTLKRVTTSDGTYRGRTAGLTYTPGDTVVFSILGDLGGFTANTVKAKSAEAFTMSAATPPAAGQPLNLTWAPVAPGAAMLVSLRYNDGTTTSTAVNAQILCDFIDDGTGTVPAALAARWAAGNAATRTAAYQRLRTVVTRGLDPSSFINVRSTFDLPTPISP